MLRRHVHLDQHAVAVALVVRRLLLRQGDAAGRDSRSEAIEARGALDDVFLDPLRAPHVMENDLHAPGKAIYAPRMR